MKLYCKELKDIQTLMQTLRNLSGAQVDYTLPVSYPVIMMPVTTITTSGIQFDNHSYSGSSEVRISARHNITTHISLEPIYVQDLLEFKYNDDVNEILNETEKEKSENSL